MPFFRLFHLIDILDYIFEVEFNYRILITVSLCSLKNHVIGIRVLLSFSPFVMQRLLGIRYGNSLGTRCLHPLPSTRYNLYPFLFVTEGMIIAF